jgi:uncharacterized caspase-like protein
MRAVGAVFLAIWSTWLFNEPAFAEKRVALVMGNSAYKNVNRLTNPVNDSAAMSETLKSAGFDVVELKRDLNVVEMRRALRDFSDKVRDADMAVVYYAGHGMEIDGVNYVIPIDAILERDIDAYDEAVSLDRILTVIEPAKELRLIILDACRDNPFNKTMKRTIGSRAIGRGLAKVEPNNPNTLIAFAAKAGSTASDGEGKNSPFTAALVKYLPKPGLDLRKAFGFARDEVLKATNNKQEPFVYGSLGGNDVALVPAPSVVTPMGLAPDPDSVIRRSYELAERVGTRQGWDSFIRNYPSGFYADLAKAQRDKLAAEEARVMATDKARLAADEQARLAAEGAKASEQAKAAALSKAAEQARVAAETANKAEETRVAEAERTKAAAEAKLAVEKVKNAQSIGPVATLTPQDEANPKAPNPAQPASADIPRLLQAELRRVGCNSGSVDGNWNIAAQKSLDLFNKNAGTKLDLRVASLDTLDAVRSKVGRICPLVCRQGYKLDHESCMKITCEPGTFLNNSNVCEKTHEKPTATREPPRATPDQPQREKVEAKPSEPEASGQFVCNNQGCRPVQKGCRLVYDNRAGGANTGYTPPTSHEVCN